MSIVSSEPTGEPLRLGLLRRGYVAATSMAALYDDARFQVLAADPSTPEWGAIARDLAGLVIATEGDPFAALGYAATVSVRVAIVVTVHPTFRSRCSDLLHAGAAACLPMPIHSADLGLLRNLLQDADRVHGRMRLVLDPLSRHVHFRGQSVRLTQREYMLLYHLRAATGRPVPAETLVAGVWGSSMTSSSKSSLEVHICLLRKKLSLIGVGDTLVTVRGHGYVLSAPRTAIPSPDVPGLAAATRPEAAALA